MTAPCPLCAGSCETREGKESILFRCETCKPFRMSPRAIKLLSTLSDDIRAGLRANVLAAHEKGMVMEIRRGAVGSNEHFSYYYE